MWLLRHISDALENAGMIFGHPIAQYCDASAESAQQSEDETDRGGLARTVGTEKTVDRSGRHVKSQVLDRERLPGAVVQAFDLNRVCHDVLISIFVSIVCCSSGSETPACCVFVMSW